MTMHEDYNGSESYARETCSHVPLKYNDILIILIIIKQCQMCADSLILC